MDSAFSGVIMIMLLLITAFTVSEYANVVV